MEIAVRLEMTLREKCIESTEESTGHPRFPTNQI